MTVRNPSISTSGGGTLAAGAAVLLAFLVFIPTSALAVGKLAGIPINIGAGADMVLAMPAHDIGDTEFELRAVELNIGAPVDPYFNLLLTLGYHDGEFELEEGWASAVLPFNFKVLLGREMIHFGYLNRIHEHDFPQVDPPHVFEELLTDHGLVGDGGHIEYLAPFLNPTLSLTFGLYNNIGHSVGRRIDGFPFLGRVQSYYQSPTGHHSILMGASCVSSFGDRDPMEGRLDDNGQTGDDRARGKINYIAGADVKYKWSPGGRTYRGLTLGGEFIYVDYDAYENHVDYVPGLNAGHDLGLYAYAAWDFNRFWGVGYRFDHTDVLFSSLEDGAKINAHSVYGQWRPTEFSRLRLQYQVLDDGREDEREHLVMLQATFFIGWHPPHRF